MNKRNVSKFLLPVLLLSVTALAQNNPTKTITLKEALASGAANSYQLGIASARYDAAKGQNLAAWKGFLPHVTIAAQYVKSDDPVTVFGLKLKQGVFAQSDFALTSLNAPDAFENYTTEFRIELPVLNVDAIFGKSAAQMMTNAQKFGVERTRQAVEFQTKAAYYGLILANQSRAAIEEAVQTAIAHRNDAKAAFDQGIINEAELLAAEVRLGEIQELQLVAENQAQSASDALRLILGMEESVLLIPADTLLRVEAPEISPDVQQYLDSRADLRSALYHQKAAARNLGAKTSAWLPNLNAFAMQEWNAADAFAKDADNYTVGVRLSWKIFDGLGHFGQRQQAAAEKRQAMLHFRQASQQARDEIDAARRELQVTQKRIEVAEKAVQQARQSLHITGQRYREGLEKTADLLGRETMFTNARLRLLQAKHDYLVAVSRLQFAIGQ